MTALVKSDDAVIWRESFSEPGIRRSLHQVRVEAEQWWTVDGSRRGSGIEIRERQIVMVECVPLKSHRNLNR